MYWPGAGLEIMRGTWFHDTSWQPVDCEHADRIEGEHIKRFMGHKMADYIWDPTNSCRREVAVSEPPPSFPRFVKFSFGGSGGAGSPGGGRSLLFQVQHSIQLEAVNKIREKRKLAEGKLAEGKDSGQTKVWPGGDIRLVR